MKRVLRICAIVLGGCLATTAKAGCPPGQEAFTSCQIAGRGTEAFVCFDDQVATYRYGPIGAVPDLVLTDSIAQVDFEAWPGVGTAIYEHVTFYNGDFSYEVGGGFERPFSDAEMEAGPRRFGWIEVAENGKVLSRLECIPETVSYGFGGGIYDVKMAAELAWDERSKTWVRDTLPQTQILQTETRRHDGGDCLPASEFALGGVVMGASAASLGKLGSPESSDVFSLAGQKADRMTVAGMTIDILHNRVIGMRATTPLWEMPSGLRVGLTRGEVIQILGHPPDGTAPNAEKFSALACLGDQDDFAKWYAVIVFGPDKRVQSLHFASLAP